MKRPIRRRPGVPRDIVDAAEYIARDNVDAALRFMDAVEATLEGLAEMPGKGPRCELGAAALADVQFYAVNGLPNYLICYRVRPEGLDVLAVLHGARDYARVLEKRE